MARICQFHSSPVKVACSWRGRQARQKRFMISERIKLHFGNLTRKHLPTRWPLRGTGRCRPEISFTRRSR